MIFPWIIVWIGFTLGQIIGWWSGRRWKHEVYIVFNKVYDYAVEGIFSSKKKAEDFIRNNSELDESDCVIECCKVE